MFYTVPFYTIIIKNNDQEKFTLGLIAVINWIGCMNEVVLMKLQIKCATFCIAHHKTIFPISALSEIGLGTVISSVYILLLLEL